MYVCQFCICIVALAVCFKLLYYLLKLFNYIMSLQRCHRYEQAWQQQTSIGIHGHKIRHISNHNNRLLCFMCYVF